MSIVEAVRIATKEKASEYYRTVEKANRQKVTQLFRWKLLMRTSCCRIESHTKRVADGGRLLLIEEF